MACLTFSYNFLVRKYRVENLRRAEATQRQFGAADDRGGSRADLWERATAPALVVEAEETMDK